MFDNVCVAGWVWPTQKRFDVAAHERHRMSLILASHAVERNRLSIVLPVQKPHAYRQQEDSGANEQELFSPGDASHRERIRLLDLKPPKYNMAMPPARTARCLFVKARGDYIAHSA